MYDYQVFSEENKMTNVLPENVHDTLAKYMLTDGFPIVLDLLNSKGARLVDEKTGDVYLDLFTFFASNPLGMNHPRINNDLVKNELLMAALNKPSNSDIYTTLMAEFVDAFGRIAKPDYMKYLFFISGGALAVENGLKVAFDWKVQKNFNKGIKEEKGHKVIHFRQAFHGRSGYTMSLTNTDVNKVKYFPKFDWPRVLNPAIRFPLDKNMETVIELEEQAIDEINSAIYNNPDDIAVIIIEPIQGEGGDNFFRKEFFLKLREIADANEVLLMFDEVQTGFGMTGKFWAADHYVKPDIISFGKKSQICGIMVSDRIDDVEEHCFRKPSRINSTWGGDITDMVRSRHILQTIADENLVENARLMGDFLLGELNGITEAFPDLVSNARGLGLMCAFDFKDATLRKTFLDKAFENKLLILGCGERSVRFRPSLTISLDELKEGLTIIKNILILMSSNN
jgi:L-lysine 6-transaminase